MELKVTVAVADPRVCVAIASYVFPAAIVSYLVFHKARTDYTEQSHQDHLR